jgi:hypothetical protein
MIINEKEGYSQTLLLLYFFRPRDIIVLMVSATGIPFDIREAAREKKTFWYASGIPAGVILFCLYETGIYTKKKSHRSSENGERYEGGEGLPISSCQRKTKKKTT